MYKYITTEHFGSIYEFLKTAAGRKNNEAMHDSNNSSDDDKKFRGTASYEEAVDLFRNGYTDILKRVLDEVSQGVKMNSGFVKMPKMMPRNEIVGYIPNVPNAIIGIPEAMINVNRVIQKKKSIDIIYSISTNCGTSCETIIKAGIALLCAIKIIELGGTFVNLRIASICTVTSTEAAMNTINLKSCHERLDIQKLCFPLAHPSMLRRFGFKWLETTPNLHDMDFSSGYGRSIESVDSIKAAFNIPETTQVLNVNWIKQHNFDVNTIIKYLKNEFK